MTDAATGRPVPGSPYAVRHAEVRAAGPVGPGVVRVTLGGADLADLPTAAPDGYLKMFFPLVRGEAPVLPAMPDDGDVGAWYRTYLALPDDRRPPMRTYTLRRRRDSDATAGGGVEIDVDLVLHGDGPGTSWARDVGVGERVAFTGPYGLYAPRDEHDAVVLVGDETAVPAIGAILEALPAGTRAEVIAVGGGTGAPTRWETAARVTTTWVDAAPDLLGALGGTDLPGDRPYVWLAGEASCVRALRRHLVRERGTDRRDVQFCGYWRRGRTEEQEVRAALAA